MQTTTTQTINQTVTSCAGINPTSSFRLRGYDVPPLSLPTRTGPYNGHVAVVPPGPTPSPNPDDIFDFYLYMWNMTAKTPLHQGTVYNIDCLGRLYTGADDDNRQYADTSYFSPKFENVYFEYVDTQFLLRGKNSS